MIWGTEILKGDFDAMRGTKKVQDMCEFGRSFIVFALCSVFWAEFRDLFSRMWGAQGFQGIPFEVRGQVWAKAIGTASG